MDRLDEWKIYVEVASGRSFSRAARAVGRSPQSITRAVAALEARLGTRLLHRTTRSVSLTSDGEHYLERGRAALAEFERLESHSRADAPLAGRLAVTAPLLFGELHVLPVVTEFLGVHPDLDVRLVLLDRVVSLADEGIDVGIRIGDLPDSSLRAHLVGRVRQVVCASPAYLRRAGVPETPDDLAAHACISFSGTTPIADRWSFPAAEGRRARSVAVRSRLVVNTAHAAIDAAVAGLGLVRTLSYQVAELVAHRKLRVVLESYERIPVPVDIVHLPGASTRATATFVDFASGRIRDRLQARGAMR